MGDREDPLRRTLNDVERPPDRPVRDRIRFVSGVIAFLVALGFLAPKLEHLASETRRLDRLSMRDAGRVPPPFPEGLVRAARAELGHAETWSLHDRSGTCSRHTAFFWLAFRLMPNTADCPSADVAIYWGSVDPPEEGRVVRRGRAFVIIRR